MASPASSITDQYLPSIAAARGQPGQRRRRNFARFVRAQECPGGQRPQRQHHQVGVVFQRVKIIERHQREQRDAGCAFGRRKIMTGDVPGRRQRNRRQHDAEQVIGPIGLRERGKPTAHDPGRQWRVLRRAGERLVRPDHRLTHVEMDVLARFRDDAIKRPRCHICGKERERRAARPHRIGQRIGQPVERMRDPGGERHWHGEIGSEHNEVTGPFVASDCLKSNRFPVNKEASSGTVAR